MHNTNIYVYDVHCTIYGVKLKLNPVTMTLILDSVECTV